MIDANGGHDAADHAALETGCPAETMHRHTTERRSGGNAVRILVFFWSEVTAVDWLFELGGYRTLLGCHVAHAEATTSLAYVIWLKAIFFEFEERPVNFVEDTIAFPAANSGRSMNVT